MARLDKQFSSNSVEWPTPDFLFAPLNKEFNFTLDVAANSENTKCSSYFTKEMNGLNQKWFGVCWMNPPYGRELKLWMKKAADEQSNGVTTVCLIPARTNTIWFHEIVIPNAEIRFVKGRPKFGGADQGLPWPLLILVFSGKKSI